MYHYMINVEPDDNDTYLITCDDLPEVTSFAETKTEIKHHATNAINEAIAARIAALEPLPQPSSSTSSPKSPSKSLATPLTHHGMKITPAPDLVIKAMLVQMMTDQGVSRADLMKRLNAHRTEIDRLFKPKTQPSIRKYQQAFEAMGKTLNLSVTDL